LLKMDILWGYNNVHIKEGDKWKAVFATNQGLFEPRVMFFRMTNSPATFQGLMNVMFSDLIAQGKVPVYLDYILVFTATLEEHWQIVGEVLEWLRCNNLYLRPKKCKFEWTTIEYLGLVISEGKITMDPVKVKAVKSWPIPRKVCDIHTFLGFTNFYRHFLENFATLACPLNDLTQKNFLLHGECMNKLPLTPFEKHSCQHRSLRFETLCALLGSRSMPQDTPWEEH
jgi:hypothetical protein